MPISLLGTVSTFLYSIVTQRAFSVSWTQPVPFDLIFDSPYIDWSRPYPNTTTAPNPVYTNSKVAQDRVDVDAMNWTSKKVDDFAARGVATIKSAWIRVSRDIVSRGFHS